MKITESFSIAGFTVIAADDMKTLYDAKKIKVDGNVYERVSAHDIGAHIAIKGEVDLTGKECVVIKE